MKYDRHCAFCGAHTSAELLRIFPGPDVSICSACAGSALQAILDERNVTVATSADAELKPACCSFCRQPATKVKWNAIVQHNHAFEQDAPKVRQ